MSYALYTDQYELTMLNAFIKDGSVNKQAVFEVFARSLPKGRRYGVFAGLGRLLPMIENFEFSGESLKWVREAKIVSKETYDYLADFSFKGTIKAYREGEIYFPNSPVLTVKGTLGECVLLETLILSVLNHDSAMATTAARMVSSAAGRPIIEMGSRRTHEESAHAVARAAYIAGFASTSNMAAGRKYGIPTTGTAAHAFTLAHDSEEEAFASQIDAQGAKTTLLIDTYDVRQGALNACKAVQALGLGEPYKYGPGAVRIDSGDLARNASMVREILDSEGAKDTRITVTSDLDEYVMKDLEKAPIDGYGVGTKLVSSKPAGFVYKLVSIESEKYVDASEKKYPYMRPVAKKSKDKASVGGEKFAYRLYNKNGKMVSEEFRTDHPLIDPTLGVRELQVIVYEDGIALHSTLEQVRAHHKSVKAELPSTEQVVWYGEDFGPFLIAEHIN